MRKSNLAIKRISGAALAALVIFSLLAVLVPGEASAHGRRTIVNDKYQIMFGFITEPAFTGQRNGIDLTVCLGTCENNPDGTLKNPVKDVDKTLKAEVIYGSSTVPVTLAPRFRADGKYDAYFFPSRAGEYTFHFTGTINGDQVDEKVVSAKDGFSSVEEPKLVPAGVSAETGLIQAQQAAKDAKDAAGTATIFGIAGVAAGILGLGLAGFALTRRPGNVSSTQQSAASGRERGPQGG
ncbi:MAG: hypothetical protein JWP00_2119 [Chloroflexi bacterium]|jgi:hypothetical protein|nr:hypothetical protein [Chloroflexota bacterium]